MPATCLQMLLNLKRLTPGLVPYTMMKGSGSETFGKRFRIREKTPNQQEFIRLWEDLIGVYEKLKASLAGRRGLAYEGMLYRGVIEQTLKESSNSVC